MGPDFFTRKWVLIFHQKMGLAFSPEMGLDFFTREEVRHREIPLFLFGRPVFSRETSDRVSKAQHNFPTAIICRRSGEIFRRSLFSDGQVKFSADHYIPTIIITVIFSPEMGPDFFTRKWVLIFSPGNGS